MRIERRGNKWRAIVRRKGEPARTGTFPTKAMAQTWGDRVEREILQRRASGESIADSMTLKALIEWFVDRDLIKLGRSKEADLARIKKYEIAEQVASTLRAQDYIKHIEGRRRDGAGPATALNDLIWIRGVLKAARAGIGLTASLQPIEDASVYLREAQLISKSRQRMRRLSADEEKVILAHFDAKRWSVPMGDIVRFALASTRRQEEITRLCWKDIDDAKGIAWLDDVKHPRKKKGNRRPFRLLPEAAAIIARQPKTSDVVFPFNSKTVGTYFTHAMHLLGIEDLRFHDLRHEATSRLFERGYSIQEVALITLHESWATLKRYANLRPENVPVREARLP